MADAMHFIVSSMYKVYLEKAFISYEKVMDAARNKIDNYANYSIKDSQAIEILKMFKLEPEFKTYEIYTKLAELLNVTCSDSS